MTRDLDDATLLNLVRAGDDSAFEIVARRHEQAAGRLAGDLMTAPGPAGQAVAATFARVLAAIKRGAGPTDAFRPYLLTALRRECQARTGGQQPEAAASGNDPGEPYPDPELAGLDSAPMARAYLSLPERWRAVLWHTEIERADPAEIVPLLGVTRHGLDALRRRATDGLRQAYLRIYRPDPDGRSAESELADVGTALRDRVAPLFLGPAAASYLAATASPVEAAGPVTRPEPVPAAGSAGAASLIDGPGPTRSSSLAPATTAAGGPVLLAAAGHGWRVAPDWFRRTSRPARWLAAAAVLVVGAGAIAVTLAGHPTGPGRPDSLQRQLAVAPSALPAGGTSLPGRTSHSPRARRPRRSPSARARSRPTAAPPAGTVAQPAVSASSSPAAADVQLAATVNVYSQGSRRGRQHGPGGWGGGGGGGGGRRGGAQVVFRVSDTGSAATGELTVSVTLPAGSGLRGFGGRGGGIGGWTCEPDSSGATCQHATIRAGENADGMIFIGLIGSAACGQPVQLTATSGSASASAQSPQDIGC